MRKGGVLSVDLQCGLRENARMRSFFVLVVYLT